MSNTGTAPIPLPPLSSRAETFPARVIGTLADPREDPSDEAVVLHLVDRRGASILHVLDSRGQLHRTDGPAVIRIGRNGQARRSWWASGTSIDNASGPATLLAQRLATSSLLSAQEAQALTRYLPRGFIVDRSGKLTAPRGAASFLTDYDLELILEYTETYDPIQELARAVTPI